LRAPIHFFSAPAARKAFESILKFEGTYARTKIRGKVASKNLSVES
jgi:hypothetical protein